MIGSEIQSGDGVRWNVKKTCIGGLSVVEVILRSHSGYDYHKYLNDDFGFFKSWCGAGSIGIESLSSYGRIEFFMSVRWLNKAYFDVVLGEKVINGSLDWKLFRFIIFVFVGELDSRSMFSDVSLSSSMMSSHENTSRPMHWPAIVSNKDGVGVSLNGGNLDRLVILFWVRLLRFVVVTDPIEWFE